MGMEVGDPNKRPLVIRLIYYTVFSPFASPGADLPKRDTTHTTPKHMRARRRRGGRVVRGVCDMQHWRRSFRALVQTLAVRVRGRGPNAPKYLHALSMVWNIRQCLNSPLPARDRRDQPGRAPFIAISCVCTAVGPHRPSSQLSQSRTSSSPPRVRGRAHRRTNCLHLVAHPRRRHAEFHEIERFSRRHSLQSHRHFPFSSMTPLALRILTILPWF